PLASVERRIQVSGRLKLGNFRVSFTDLTVPVAGIPITVSRTYDTLQSDTRKDLGYGWRLDVGDADLKFHSPNGQYQSFGRFPALRYDDQVVLTRPGGEPERFFFRPRQVQGWPIPRYQPWFDPDAGVTSVLVVQPVLLQLLNDFGGMY